MFARNLIYNSEHYDIYLYLWEYYINYIDHIIYIII